MISHLLLLCCPCTAAAVPPPAPISQDPFLDPVPVLGQAGNANAVATGDLDRDGLEDIVVGGRGIYVHLSRGGGAFERARVVQAARPTSVFQGQLALGDVNGDGDLDLAIQRSTAWEIRLGDGRGGFDAQVASGANGDHHRLEFHDLDGDGDQDLVVGTGLPDTGGVAWFENQGGTFPGPRRALVSGSLWRVVDLDQDGLMDVVRLPRLGETDLLFLRGLGSGNFAAPSVLVVVPQAQTSLLLDWEGDGDLDVLTIAAQDFQLLEALAPGTFAAPAPVVSASNPGYSVLYDALDLNDDGWSDLVGGTIDPPTFNLVPRPVILFGTGPGTFGPAVDGLGIGVEGEGAELPRFADVDGDGRPDLVGGAQRATVYRNATAGAGPPFVASRDLSGPLFDHAALCAADVDGDLVPDLVCAATSGQAIQVYRGEPGAVFHGLVESSNIGIDANRLFTGDLDGDGDLDLVAHRRWGTGGTVVLLAGDGAGRFSRWIVPPLSLGLGQPRSVDVADLDGDGVDEVLTGSTTGVFLVEVVPGTSMASSTQLSTGRKGAFLDVDQDGDMDVVSYGLTDVSWRENTGAGALAPEALLAPGGGLNTGGLLDFARLGDVDGDSLGDLILAGPTAALMARRVSIQPPVFDALEPLASVPAPSRLDVLDVTGDGLVDLVATGDGTAGTADVVLRENEGAANFSAPVPLGRTGFVAASTRLEDVDADGDADLVVHGLASMVLFENGNEASVGTVSCGPAAPNSTGQPARIRAFGELSVSSESLVLRADRLPQGQFGIFAGSRVVTAPMTIPGSAGRLCLGGAIGRYDGPGQVLGSGPSGSFQLTLDPARLQLPNGTVPAMAGESWTFQAWFRDVGAMGPTSNLTDAVSLTF